MLFNVSEAADGLRGAQCQAHLMHAIPSHAMVTDALAQYLVAKKWRDVLVLEGPLAEDAAFVRAFEKTSALLKSSSAGLALAAGLKALKCCAGQPSRITRTACRGAPGALAIASASAGLLKPSRPAKTTTVNRISSQIFLLFIAWSGRLKHEGLGVCPWKNVSDAAGGVSR